MAKRKITPEILADIEMYGEDQSTLEETLECLDLSKSLIKDELVLQAFECGQINLFIQMAALDVIDEEISSDFDISIEKCMQWRKTYTQQIADAKQKIVDDEELNTKQFSSPLMQGMRNVMTQRGEGPPISQKVLADDIKGMVKSLQDGNSKDLLTVLCSNIVQLQMFNSTIGGNISGEIGKDAQHFEKLSLLQLKVMAESRKIIMAINEITNPKRTTFIKKAEQHNHLHQNSEKNNESQNEQSQKQIEHQANGEDHAYQYTEAETVTERTHQASEAVGEVNGAKDTRG